MAVWLLNNKRGRKTTPVKMSRNRYGHFYTFIKCTKILKKKTRRRGLSKNVIHAEEVFGITVLNRGRLRWKK